MPALFAARACARGAGAAGVRRLHTAQLRLAATPPAKLDPKKGVERRGISSMPALSEPSVDYSALLEESFRDLYARVDKVSQTHPIKFFLGVVTFGVASLKFYDARYGMHRSAVDMSARGAAGAADDDDDDEDDDE